MFLTVSFGLVTEHHSCVESIFLYAVNVSVVQTYPVVPDAFSNKTRCLASSPALAPTLLYWGGVVVGLVLFFLLFYFVPLRHPGAAWSHRAPYAVMGIGAAVTPSCCPPRRGKHQGQPLAAKKHTAHSRRGGWAGEQVPNAVDLGCMTTPP